jgi:MYXO-CTERM domain-containing protein
MRKTLAVLSLTAALTGGTAATALADDAVAAPPVTQTDTNTQESDKTGLWGLLGLLGLAGLAKRKEHAGADSSRR